MQLAFAQVQLEGETIDLSLDGMLVRVLRTFPKGTLLELNLYLPATDRPIVGLGLVMRVAGSNEMGIKIDRLTIEDSGRLQEYLLRVCVA